MQMKMEEKSFIINKLEYFWYEGGHWAMLLEKISGKDLEKIRDKVFNDSCLVWHLLTLT